MNRGRDRVKFGGINSVSEYFARICIHNFLKIKKRAFILSVAINSSVLFDELNRVGVWKVSPFPSEPVNPSGLEEEGEHEGPPLGSTEQSERGKGWFGFSVKTVART